MSVLDTLGDRQLMGERDRADLLVGGALRRSWRFAPGGAILVTDGEDPYAAGARRRVFRAQALGEVVTGWNGHVARLTSRDGPRGAGAAWHEPVAARILNDESIVLVLRAVMSSRTTESAWWLRGWEVWSAPVPHVGDPELWDSVLPRPEEVREGSVRWSDGEWRDAVAGPLLDDE
jgi:hypothetical protein